MELYRVQKASLEEGKADRPWEDRPVADVI